MICTAHTARKHQANQGAAWEAAGESRRQKWKEGNEEETEPERLSS